MWLLGSAEREKDAELLEAFLGSLKETAEHDRRAEEVIPELEKSLEQLKGEER